MCVGVLSVGLGPGLDSMSPARSRRGRGGVGGYNLHSVPPNSPPTVALWHTNHEQAVSVWCLQTTSSHLSKELDCTTLCNSFIVLFEYIYIYIYRCYFNLLVV